MTEIPPAYDPELYMIRRRQLELMRQKADLRKNFGLHFYRPHLKQHNFHVALAGGKPAKRRYQRAGNRFGKSDMGVAEDCAWLLGYRPWYMYSFPIYNGKGKVVHFHNGSDNHPFVRMGIPQRPVKGIVIAADWDKVREIFTEDQGANLGKIWKFIPKDEVQTIRRTQKGIIDFIALKNGSTITFDTVKSFLTNPMGSESSAWDFVHVDEPCPEKMYRAQARGLVDNDGFSWFTLTPLSEPWIDDEFFPRAIQRMAEALRTDQPISIDDRKWAQQGSMYDNPHLTEEAINDYLSTLKPDERECREKGIPLERSGLIFKEFDYAAHVLQSLPRYTTPVLDLTGNPTGNHSHHTWEAFDKPPKHFTFGYALDPHPQTPHAVLFFAVCPMGHVYFYDEYFVHESFKQLGAAISTRIAGCHVRYEIADPSAFNEHPTTMTSCADDLAPYGLFPEEGSKDLSRGIVKTQEVLLYRDSEGAPIVHFAPHLTETLWEFEHYIWDTKRPDKPRDQDDHMMENFRRIVVDWPIHPTYHPMDDKGREIKDMEITEGINEDDFFNAQEDLRHDLR